MKPIKLEVGQIWQVPDKKWIRVREIVEIESDSLDVAYCELGSCYADWITRKAFLNWIRRNKLKKPIGMVDSKTGKVRVVQ